MHAVDVFSLALAVLCGLITAALKPWSKQWWAGVVITTVIGALAAGDMFFGDVFSGMYDVVTHKTAPQPPKPPPKPEPPKPCASQEEIDAQHKIGRILVNRCPSELLADWQHSQDIGIYLNKWIKVDGVFSAPTQQTIGKKRFLVIDFRLNSGVFATESMVSMYFDQEKWEAKLLALQTGDPIKAICQFSRVDRKESMRQGMIIIYLDKLIAEPCDPL
jgi:hypothetical protein